MQTPDRLNQAMGGAIHLLDGLLKSRPKIPEPVVDLVYKTLIGTAQVIEYALDRGMEVVTKSPEKVG